MNQPTRAPHKPASVSSALLSLGAGLLALTATPALAQDVQSAGGTVFDGDWLIVGGGALYGPSYDGSDDYVVDPIAAVQGRVLGIGINAKPSGLSLDFINDGANKISFAAGPSARLRSSRAVHIKDPVVADLGKLRRAIEIGGTVGVSFNRLLSDYDSLSLSVDARVDVNGAHGGTVINPGVSYFTPLTPGIGVVIGADAEHGDDDFMDYYFSVTPGGTVASGLPTYQARSGWRRVGGSALAAFDLDGDLTNGGLVLVAFGSYNRLINDAAASPIVSIRGSRDQWTGGLGLGITF